ncbi:MAG: twin-arginine translocation signal domain-containing protein [Candidatus Eremiobacterota bacterium]
MNKQCSKIEKILLRASTDKNFRDKLLEDRESVIESREYLLTDVDKIFLNNIPPQKLNDMIEHFITQKNSRRNFIKGAAASMALLVCGTVMTPSLGRSYSAGMDTDTGTWSGDSIPGIDTGSNLAPVLCKTAGIEGITIIYEYTGFSIIIPANALDKSVTISITISEPFYSYVYKISPDYITFLKEIDLCFPVPTHIKNISGYTWNGTKWDVIPVSISDRFAIVKTKKLGIYTVKYI